MGAVLNHIGIAVKDRAVVEKLFSLLGLKISRSERVEEQGVITHFVPLPVEPAQLELLEVLDPQGTVARFLEKKGPGVHHLSFLVEKGRLEGICEELRAHGYQLVYDKPRLGAHAMRVNFVHPATAGGLLIEVMEPV